jgi:tripartite-type tricarboxylate transporter receptor subunit TctC
MVKRMPALSSRTYASAAVILLAPPAILHAQPASTKPVLSLSKDAGQAYPAKPVRMVSPYPPGSSADIIGRIYAPKLTDALGRHFVVDNRSGASGNIAAEIVARAAPDGYTLLLINTAVVASQPLYKNLPFDVSRDFQAVGMLGIAAYLLVVNNAVPARTLPELVALAKSRAGKLVYASTGVGGGLHLTMELLMMQTGVKMLHVPYKGSGAAVPDVISGQIDTMFGSAPALLPHVKSGRIRALGITSLKRGAVFPDIPTLAESGLPGFESVSFTALAVPTGTPREVIARLNTVINQSARSAETATALANQSTDAAPMTPGETTAFIREEIAKWRKVVIAAGVKGE